jgi:hypothetical protein
MGKHVASDRYALRDEPAEGFEPTTASSPAFTPVRPVTPVIPAGPPPVPYEPELAPRPAVTPVPTFEPDHEFDPVAAFDAIDPIGPMTATGLFDPEPDPTEPVRGRSMPAVFLTGVALLGAAILVTGAVQLSRLNLVDGSPMALSGSDLVATHQAEVSAGLLSGHLPGSRRPASPAAQPNNKPAANAAQAPAQPNKPAASVPGTQLPNTIRLPQGGTAYLVHGEIGEDGALPIPSGVNQAVWWGTGLTASAGATVFAGHVNWAGVTGPFAELWQDVVGDQVTITDNSGTVWRFQVTQVLTLNKQQLPAQAPALFSATGQHRIVLATCGGEWVGGALGYADNRLLVAVPVTG